MTTTGRLSCPPRFATPRNPDRATLGPQVVEVARRLGYTLMPWQEHLLNVAFELDERGDLYYVEVVALVPRQQGKTLVMVPVAVHRLVALARQLGPQRLTFTAQKRQSARKKLERDFAEILRGSRSFREITNPKARPAKATEWKLSLNNGSEHIRIGKSYWQIDAPSRTGTHGDTLDLGMIDEAFAHQSDDVELAMKPAQATRRSAQLWVISAAGDAKSYYLARKVLAGRAAHEAGDHGRVAYFEWSAPDELDPGDPATWRVAMPALGITVTEEFVAAEWDRAQRKGPEGIAMFRRSYLNQWPEFPVLEETFETVWAPGVWAAACADDVEQPKKGIVFALDVNPERSKASIAAAGPTSVGLVDERSGVGWALDEVVKLAKKYRATVAVAAASPAGSMIADLERSGVKVRSVSWPEVRAACGWFYDAITDRKIQVLADADLDRAVSVAVRKPSGDAWVWDRKSGDVCSLVAVTLAAWTAGNGPRPAKADISGLIDRDAFEAELAQILKDEADAMDDLDG